MPQLPSELVLQANLNLALDGKGIHPDKRAALTAARDTAAAAAVAGERNLLDAWGSSERCS